MHIKINRHEQMDLISTCSSVTASSYPEVGSFLSSLKNIDPFGLVLEFALLVDKISDLH